MAHTQATLDAMRRPAIVDLCSANGIKIPNTADKGDGQHERTVHVLAPARRQQALEEGVAHQDHQRRLQKRRVEHVAKKQEHSRKQPRAAVLRHALRNRQHQVGQRRRCDGRSKVLRARPSSGSSGPQTRRARCLS